MVFDIKCSTQMIRAQRRTSIILALFGSIPLGVGIRIRRLIYPAILGGMGKGVVFEPNIELTRAEGIFLGEEVTLAANSIFNAWYANSRMIFHNRVHVDRGVHLQSLGGCIEVGEATYIGPYVCAAGPGDITIGKSCLIASHSSIYANNHIFSDPNIPISDQGVTCKGIVIEDDCWIGSGVRILDGVTIGQGSVIGAGAVVSRSIPPYSVAVGVPARVIARRGEVGESKLARLKSMV